MKSLNKKDHDLLVLCQRRLSWSSASTTKLGSLLQGKYKYFNLEMWIRSLGHLC